VDLAAPDALLLARLQPPTPTVWDRYNPLTKAVLAASTTIAALVLGGYLTQVLLFAALVLPGAIAGQVLGRVVRTAALATLPLAVAVGLVSVFTRPGTTILFQVGPFDATLEGLDFAARVVVRLFVMASALILFGATSSPRAFVVDLERRGVSPRLAFAIGAVLDTVPAIVTRAREVLEAQQARGLDTEGSFLRRAASILPLAGPVVVGALHHVEARSLGLEARGFGRPGPRHLLWAPADTSTERAIRWLLFVAVVALVLAAAASALPHAP
jgi:energy-coupling factor transport system permease protein